MESLQGLDLELKKHENKKQGEILQRFFKTGKGEYGEGDVFLGIKVPQQRRIARQFKDLPLSDTQILLNSKVHEKRLIALLILIRRFEKGNEVDKKKIFDFYLKNTEQINNWDLVDLSAPNIVGNFLLDKPRDILYDLAVSDNLWEKRIAVVSTFSFIRAGEFNDSLKIAEILLKDKHDLIHKAVGWMLREIGKKNERILEDFLNKHCLNMPRTMLRYAIEKFEEGKRLKYLKYGQ